jgi:hypothetical protein
MLRNRMLGGVSSFAMMAPDGVDGGGSGGEVNTDVLLHELASQAFDDVAAAADGTEAGRAPETRAAEKPAGAEKAAAPGKEPAQAQKTNPEPRPAADRGDGRAPDGKFVRKTPAEVAAAAKTGSDPAKAAGQDPAAADGQQQQQQQAPVAAAPPHGWSPKSKAEWDRLPPHIREDIAKRELEVANGFREYEGVKPFLARAKAAGQSLGQALTAYTGIEDLIRRDFSSGVMHIAQNAGLTQHEAARAFGTIAQRLGFQFSAPASQPAGGSPAHQPAGGPDPDALRQLLEPVLKPILERVNTIDTTFRSQAEGVRTQRLTEAQRVVETFRTDPAHKYYANLEDRIGDLLDRGIVQRTGDLAADLKAAYEMAAYADPEIRELLINERQAATAGERTRQANEEAQRARSASRSVTGAPAPGAREGRRVGNDALHSLAAQAYDEAAGRV